MFPNLVELCDQLRGRLGEAEPSPPKYAPMATPTPTAELVLVGVLALADGAVDVDVIIIKAASLSSCF